MKEKSNSNLMYYKNNSIMMNFIINRSKNLNEITMYQIIS